MTNANTNAIPEGYLRNTKGHLVPKHLIRPLDLQRDTLVREIAERAKHASAELTRFKRQLLGDIAAFLELAAEQYEVTIEGKKGNVTLTSYDGQYKVVRAVQDRLAFDERLQIAKQLVDDCVREWARGADDRVKALVEHAFQVDKQGKISTERVLGLRKLEIDSEPWQRAMAAIADSITVASSTTYVRVYERIGDSDAYRPINLEFSSL